MKTGNAIGATTTEPIEGNDVLSDLALKILRASLQRYQKDQIDHEEDYTYFSANANRSSLKRDNVINSIKETEEAIARLLNPDHVGNTEPTVAQPVIPEKLPPG